MFEYFNHFCSVYAWNQGILKDALGRYILGRKTVEEEEGSSTFGSG